MAGAGYKLFSTNDVLTAGDLNTYIQEQSVMRFATTAARDSALTSVLAEGMTCYIDDITGNGTAGKCVYDGAAWVITWSEWESFTPSWTNLTIGNGTQVWSFRYVGGDIRVRGGIGFGSTTSISGGVVTMTIPDSFTSAGVSAGSAYFRDAGTRYFLGVAFRASSTTIGLISVEAIYDITATTPFTWTTGDEINFDVTIGA